MEIILEANPEDRQVKENAKEECLGSKSDLQRRGRARVGRLQAHFAFFEPAMAKAERTLALAPRAGQYRAGWQQQPMSTIS
eukprot:5062046-Pleurochrysis_carterae.AAC.2